MKCIVAAVVATACTVCVAGRRPDLVERVRSGEITEARVSWWGFDASDSTPFIKAALSSGAKKIVFDKAAGPWVTLPLVVERAAGLEILLEPGVELVARRGEFKDVRDALLTVRNSRGVKISGSGAALRMWRDDYTRAPYEKGEWRHTLSLMKSSEVSVHGLRLAESGGDGIYVNDVKDCVVRGVVCDRNLRQGISVISAENLLIEDCTLSNTKGAPPEAGIDFEPNRASERIVNCVMRNCTIFGNAGNGIEMYLNPLDAASRDVSLLFEDCRVAGNKWGFCLSSDDPPLRSVKGEVVMRRCVFDRPEKGARVFMVPEMPIKAKFEDCVLRMGKHGGGVEETRLDDAWLAQFARDEKVPPGVKIVDNLGLGRAVVHDARPGEAVRFSPLKMRNALDFVFYATKAGTVRFSARQCKFGAKGRLMTGPVSVKDESGREVAKINMSDVGESETPFSVAVPAAGYYFFRVKNAFSLFSILSSDAPVAVDVRKSCVNLNSCEGSLYVPVPDGCGRFAVFVSGAFPREVVAAKVTDPSGREVWGRDAICMWHTCVSPEKPSPGVWTVSFARPQQGRFDDYKCEVGGLPALLFLSPEKYWCTAPVAPVESVEETVVEVDFSHEVGPVKPVNGVGQPPMVGKLSGWPMFHYLKEAGIPYSRLHDVSGWLGGGLFVDIPNLFPDFDADENDPRSYCFAYTDSLMKALDANGVEPFFRLGVSIENFVYFKDRFPPKNILPPKDFAKWARICEHVIRHYTEGWADGFRMKVTYWEIWNEPENHPDDNLNPMFRGPFSEYMRLYGVVATHLKKCFPHLKIGGYGHCGFYAGVGSDHVPAANSSPRMQYFVECSHKFLAAARDNKWPLDFFSYHSYSAPKEALRQVRFADEHLNEYGFTADKCERIFNEWLPYVKHENLGSSLQAAGVAAELIGLQNGPCDVACIYDARCGVGNYSPLFNPLTCKPHKAYYAFTAFNELRKRGKAVAVHKSGDKDVWIAAAKGEKDAAVMVANDSDRVVPLACDFMGRKVLGCRITDDSRTDEAIPFPNELPPHSFVVAILDNGAAGAMK